jgi:hypothetical protein
VLNCQMKSPSISIILNLNKRYFLNVAQEHLKSEPELLNRGGKKDFVDASAHLCSARSVSITCTTSNYIFVNATFCRTSSITVKN